MPPCPTAPPLPRPSEGRRHRGPADPAASTGLGLLPRREASSSHIPNDVIAPRPDRDIDHDGAGHAIRGRPNLGRTFHQAGDQAAGRHRSHGFNPAGPGEVAAERVSVCATRRRRQLHRVTDTDPGGGSADGHPCYGVGLLNSIACIPTAATEQCGDQNQSDDAGPAHLSWPPGDGQQMGARSDHRRFSLEHPRHPQQCFAPLRISHPLRNVRQNPPRTLHAVHAFQTQSGGVDFLPEIIGPMEVGGGEVIQPLGRIAMLAVLQIPPHNALEPGVVEEVAGESVERRCEARDGRCAEPAAGLQHSRCLVQRLRAISGFCEVVHRPHQQDHVGSSIRYIQRARIADSARRQRPLGETAAPLRFCHESRGRVDQVHRIAALGQPQRIRSSRPADVEHGGGRLWCKAHNQLAGARLLQLERPLLEPSLLGGAMVELSDVRIDVVAGRFTHAEFPRVRGG